MFIAVQVNAMTSSLGATCFKRELVDLPNIFRSYGAREISCRGKL